MEKINIGSKKPAKTVEILTELYDLSYQLLSEFSFEFYLLLPEETADINVRAESLGLWCQGFLTGLELCDIPIQDRPDNDATEALNDMMEIAQVNYGDILDNEEDESAYYELVEHIRLSVLMIYQDNKSGDDAMDNGPLLH